MIEEKVLETQSGVWIEEGFLRKAMLGPRLKVAVEEGEIRITAAPGNGEVETGSELAWDVFREIGNDAQPGRLENAAAEHDRHLYEKGR